MIEFFLILGAFTLYFAPLLVAAWLRHPKLAYIGGLNAALGVTVIGWAGAMIWALRRRSAVVRAYSDAHLPRPLNVGLLAVAGLLVGVAAVATIGVNRLQAGGAWSVPALFAAAPAIPAQWQYATADGARTASLQSRNRLKEPAPFKGGPATLSLARGADGYVVRLDVDGDMACSYAPTASTVQVSFDGGAPRTFACASAPGDPSKLLFDGAHSTAYFADPVAFLAQLRNARHVRIVGEFAGQAASQAMEFDLPPGDPVAEVSPASVQLAQAPVAAGTAPSSSPVTSSVPVSPPAVAAVAVAPPPKATPAADIVAGGNRISIREHHGAVRLSVRRHVPGYYLHPYHPAFRPAHRKVYW
jgi:hypothetical protein